MGMTVVIAAVDETATLPQVLAQCQRLRLDRILVVANGPDDGAARAATRAGASVLRYPARLGHDVGRALGAAELKGSSILFLDADVAVEADDLIHFLRAVEDGTDVALNRLDSFLHPMARLHPVNAAKRFLNCALGRPDLGCASLTAVPHALSVKALQTLDPSDLAVPPRAMVRAVTACLQVEAVYPVDVIRANARRPGLNLGDGSPVEQLILGDHLEAISALLSTGRDVRGGFTDLGRRRDLLTQ